MKLPHFHVITRGVIIRLIIKFCSVAVAVAAIVFAQLGPGDWLPRTGLGWQTEHVLAYFVVTSIVCLVWPRPFVVGPAFMAASVLLEGLQVLTPNRHAVFWPDCTAQAGRSRRLCLLSFSRE